MWSSCRILSLHRPLLAYLPSSASRLAPVQPAAASSKFDAACGRFLPWLQEKTAHEITSTLSIGMSTYGRALFASKPIYSGQCILEVPYSVHLTPHNIQPEIRPLFGNDVSDIGLLAIVLLTEKQHDQKSGWEPYISILPSYEEMNNTIFWDEDELEMIRWSPAYQETLHQKTIIKKEFAMIKPVLENVLPFLGNIALQDFMHACALVGSRAWGTTKGLSLIPFADFLNHDGVSNAMLLSNEDKDISEVIADRDYSAGEQVLIRYGNFSNSTLIVDFGFTFAYNIHDQVQIWMDVPQHDPLCTKKQELLQKHNIPASNSSNEFHSPHTCFTIKEVRSAQGKGKGIPQSLRAFARVLSATSSEELEEMASEAAASDGRLARSPLKNRKLEIRAHQILLSHIIHVAANYDSSIKSLNALEAATSSSQRSLRRKMARDLLTGERRVLNSARRWLTHYCEGLPPAS